MAVDRPRGNTVVLERAVDAGRPVERLADPDAASGVPRRKSVTKP